MQKPLADEYNPSAAAYIALVGQGAFSELLKENTATVLDFFSSIPAAKHDYAYAPGKWTVRQIVQHLTDTERVMCYRAFVVSRGDTQAVLTSMDEKQYAAEVEMKGRNMATLLEEFATVRKASEMLFANISEQQSRYIGNTFGFPVTPRALGYIIVGHPLHHINIMKERYL